MNVAFNPRLLRIPVSLNTLFVDYSSMAWYVSKQFVLFIKIYVGS